MKKAKPRKPATRKKKINKLYYLSMNISIALLIIVLIFAIYLLVNTLTQSQIYPQSQTGQVTDIFVSSEEALAKCLTEKGAVMYGAYWCGHTGNQKDMFGEAFEYVAYVECTENQEVCYNAGVTGYPTWIINEQPYPGEKQLLTLSGLADCEYM